MLQAALEVIVERGYADTRIADVAERSGTSPALVIYYFKTRDQLLTEAIRYSEDSWYAEGLRRLGEIPAAVGIVSSRSMNSAYQVSSEYRMASVSSWSRVLK